MKTILIIETDQKLFEAELKRQLKLGYEVVPKSKVVLVDKGNQKVHSVHLRRK